MSDAIARIRVHADDRAMTLKYLSASCFSSSRPHSTSFSTNQRCEEYAIRPAREHVEYVHL